jgi:hypothetical protein
MNTLTKIALGAAVLAVSVGTTFATTTDELQITAGGLTATITDNGTCVGSGCAALSNDENLSAGTTTVSGSIDGWNIFVTSGTSYSPGDVPFALDIASLTATCAGGGCSADPLDIKYSDVGFSPASPGYQTTYSSTMTGSNASTTESAYYSNSNTLFTESTLIGTVGPFTTSNAGSASGGAGSVAPFSLTLDQMFSDVGGGAASFSVDGNLTAVPEPAAVMLFGTVLALCATRLRRMRRNGSPEADNK